MLSNFNIIRREVTCRHALMNLRASYNPVKLSFRSYKSGRPSNAILKGGIISKSDLNTEVEKVHESTYLKHSFALSWMLFTRNRCHHLDDLVILFTSLLKGSRDKMDRNMGNSLECRLRSLEECILFDFSSAHADQYMYKSVPNSEESWRYFNHYRHEVVLMFYFLDKFSLNLRWIGDGLLMECSY